MSLHVKAVNLHLVTLSEKLGFLSGKNYDVFGSHQVCAVHYRNASPRCLSAELGASVSATTFGDVEGEDADV